MAPPPAAQRPLPAPQGRPPSPTAGDIIAHYLRNLTIASGKRWSAANDRDMRHLGELLAELGQTGESIPAFLAEPSLPAPAERVTVAFDKPTTAEDDPSFARWKRERDVEDERAVARMTRAGGAR